ncbi:MAG: hypothetical protein KR126chlam3_01305 [Chlamydiae bacterium]|nr:hypothetical protein [Chlamydiota bacterium]NGX60139.1 hypothetical protein [Chlamydiota bacterium]
MERADEVKKRKKLTTQTILPSKLKKKAIAQESLEKINKKYGRALKNLSKYR